MLLSIVLQYIFFAVETGFNTINFRSFAKTNNSIPVGSQPKTDGIFCLFVCL
jgi:hypothetical protein